MKNDITQRHGEDLERLISVHIRYAKNVRMRAKLKRLTMWITSILSLKAVSCWIGTIFNRSAASVTVIRPPAKDEVMIVSRLKVAVRDNKDGTFNWIAKGGAVSSVEVGSELMKQDDEVLASIVIGVPVVVAATDVTRYVKVFESITERRIFETVMKDIANEYVK
jgi:hypothetical protein